MFPTMGPETNSCFAPLERKLTITVRLEVECTVTDSLFANRCDLRNLWIRFSSGEPQSLPNIERRPRLFRRKHYCFQSTVVRGRDAGRLVRFRRGRQRLFVLDQNKFGSVDRPLIGFDLGETILKAIAYRRLVAP